MEAQPAAYKSRLNPAPAHSPDERFVLDCSGDSLRPMKWQQQLAALRSACGRIRVQFLAQQQVQLAPGPVRKKNAPTVQVNPQTNPSWQLVHRPARHVGRHVKTECQRFQQKRCANC
jgi:hypothetical protein